VDLVILRRDFRTTILRIGYPDYASTQLRSLIHAEFKFGEKKLLKDRDGLSLPSPRNAQFEQFDDVNSSRKNVVFSQ
jgi:hypothetical protein